MRLTIIRDGGFVAIDREGFDNIDLSVLPDNIHAVQWYGEDGEVEVKNARGQIVENRSITDITEFMFVVPLWQQAKDKVAANANQT